MAPEHAKSTLYYDGSCPLCRAEIGYYSRTDEAGGLCFVDVSQAEAAAPEGLTQREAMQRFHVRASDGRVLSGAEAFVEVWRRAAAMALGGALGVAAGRIGGAGTGLPAVSSGAAVHLPQRRALPATQGG